MRGRHTSLCLDLWASIRHGNRNRYSVTTHRWLDSVEGKECQSE